MRQIWHAAITSVFQDLQHTSIFIITAVTGTQDTYQNSLLITDYFLLVH
jgi:hypothetical protein